MKLQTLFEQKRAKNQKAFVAFITAGDPSLESTIEYAEALERAGVDVLELGVPHTDPIADGPTNSSAAERALLQGGGLPQTLELARRLRAKGSKLPLVLFTYLNPILRMGYDSFARKARESGIDGVLVVDLPPEESEAYCTALSIQHLETVFLVSKTTSKTRLRLISKLSTGFVYYVCRSGVTGAKHFLPATLGAEMKHLRDIIEKPICVGFGISTPAQVSEVAGLSDGVIVGSAFVDIISRHTVFQSQIPQLERLAESLVGATANRKKEIC